MRIVLLVSSLRGGGAERVATTLANAWVARGDEVLLVPTYLADASSVYALDPRVQLRGLGEWMPRTPLPPTIACKWRALRRLLREEQPDVAVSFLTNVNVMTLLSGRGLDVPLVVCERSHPGVSQSAGALLRLARRCLYPRADTVVMQTQASVPALLAAAPGTRTVAVVPNPLPPALMQIPRDEAEPLHGRFRLIGMGRLVQAKRFDRLIDAFMRLAPAFPHWDLYLWGEGPLRDTLQAQAEQAGVGGRVFFPGRTDTPWEVLAHADAVALTSDVEGFPNVLLEAMALGRACVAVDCPSGPRELSEDGQVALLVGRDDKRGLRDALARVMRDAGLRASLGARARASVRQRFALPAVLAQWDTVFERAQGQGDHRAHCREGALRVCHVIGGLGLGGAEAVLHRLASTPQAGVCHEVVSLGGLDVYGARLQAAGVPVRALGLSRSPASWLRGIGQLWQLWRRWREQPPDVVQTWMYHADLLGGLLARMTNVPTVVWGIRNAGAALDSASRLSRCSQWLGARLSWRIPDRIIACSHDAAQRHAARGYDAARLCVVPNGYDLSRWQPAPTEAARWRAAMREAWGAGRDTVVLGLVARWHPLKDHATLLDALARLTSTHWLCVLVGPGMDENNKALAALLATHGLAERVRLLGPRHDIPAIMAGLDVHVLSSLSEGFPNVVAEAMASGVPAVVTDVGDAARIVGDTGWVVPPRQPDALATALATVIARAQEGSLPTWGERARARVQALYSLDTMQHAFLATWQAAAAPLPPRLLMVVNNPAFFLSHRLPVAEAARAAGYHVELATMPGPSVAEIESLGFLHHPLAMSRSGQNPLREAGTLYSLWRLMRRRRPDLVHAVTIKPVLYGGMAARLAGVRGLVAAISGMGFLYTDGPRQTGTRQSVLRALTSWLYRRALRHPNSRVIVQNSADADTLRAMGALRGAEPVLIPGSGVDLTQYRPHAEPPGPIVVVMAARLLADKGVREFAEAARQTRATPGIALRWVLAGDMDPGNPAAIHPDELAAWQRDGLLTWVGQCDDIAQLYADSHIVVLPSYREGLPRALAEAAACGRPVVTTDVPGCRDAILPDQTGLLVPAGDAAALADAVRRLATDPSLRARMGEAGRAWAERVFDIQEVVRAHLRVYEALLPASAGQTPLPQPRHTASHD